MTARVAKGLSVPFSSHLTSLTLHGRQRRDRGGWFLLPAALLAPVHLDFRRANQHGAARIHLVRVSGSL